MIHGNNPNPILEYLTFILEDFQLISFAFSYKLNVNMLPDWIQEIMDILEYHGEDYNYDKYKLIFGLSAFAVVIMVMNLAYIFYGCWVSLQQYNMMTMRSNRPYYFEERSLRVHLAYPFGPLPGHHPAHRIVYPNRSYAAGRF
jgi:hypothetical protein